MWRFVVWGLALGVAGGSAVAAEIPALPTKAQTKSQDQVWTIVFDSELRMTSWKSDRGVPTTTAPLGAGKGSQVYLPFSVSATGTPIANWKFEFLGRSGYVSSRQRTPGMEASVSHFTDTILSATVTYLGINGFVPFVSMVINAPTGKAALFGMQRFARGDPDIVDVPTFGEGWNIGPTVGANIPITAELMFSAGAGITFRNAFDREGNIDPVTGAQPPQRLDPGDVTTYNGSLSYQKDAFSAQIAVSRSTETPTYVDYMQNYRAGARTTVSGAVGYKWNESWTTSVNGYYTYANRNQALDIVGALIPEQFNSNNRIYRINAEHMWTDGKWTAGPTGSYLNRANNAYDTTFFQFIPAKTRYSVGGVAKYGIDAKTQINGRVERIWANEQPFPAFAVQTVHTDAWLLAVGATVQR